MLRCCLAFAMVVGFTFSAAAREGELAASLQKGNVDLQSAGPLAFGPEGILFVGDPVGAAVFAIDTGDRGPRSAGEVEVPEIETKIASRLGTTAKQIRVVDLAINPLSGNVYLSVSRGLGPDAAAVLLRLAPDGNLAELKLEGARFSKVTLGNPPDPEAKDRRGNSLRQEAITDLAYVDGRVIVAGLSNEEFASKLRSIPVPFEKADEGTSVEIYHGAHGQYETRAPVRTFAVYAIQRQPHLLAAYTCTPLVKFPLADLKPGAKVRGTTIAELGNMNRPLDMVIYRKDGKDFILTANSARGVMKITTEDIEQAPAITEKIKDKAGLAYETIDDLQGVEQLDKLDEERAVVLVRDKETKVASLQTVALP